MAVKLSQLTDNSWVFKHNSAFGLLFKIKDQYNLKTSTSSMNFCSISDIEQKFGKVSYEERESYNSDNNINGYPVKDKNFVIKDETKLIYVKKNSYDISNVEFYAGFWSIKYPNGWASNLCPKVSTTEQYQSQGPFRTNLECKNNNHLLNTRENVKKE